MFETTRLAYARGSSGLTIMNTPTQDWQAPLVPLLAALETERLNARKKLTNIGLIIACIAGVAILYLIATGNFFTPFLLFFPLIIAGVIFAFVYTSATSQYRAGFKNMVMPHLVRHCAQEANASLMYLSSEGISENEFRNSGLFRHPDRYSSEDYIHGTIGETALRFSEVHAEYREVRSDGKNTRTEYHTIFKGLFLVADFNKHFQGTTYVKPDVAEKMFGRFGQSLQQLGASFSFGARELVRLEDPEFERTFVVYSTDQTEARYILSPALMERLLKFRARCNTDIHLAFIGGQMILAIPLAVAWLEPPALGTPLTLQSLEGSLNQLRFAIGIVAELDLNTRIWSK